MGEGVDLVYTWVDGSKASHVAARTRHRFRESVAADNTWVRWADRGELQYSLRSVEQNAPLFRKIFVVCMDGQKPKWLKESDRIKIVRHSEFIPADFLPTFCSTVIEAFLHRIPGLSEKFVYSNDDFIFLRQVDLLTFFDGGKPVIYLGQKASAQGGVTPNDDGHLAGIKNANSLLSRQFGPESRREIYHYPLALTKTGCQRAWEAFGTELLVSAKSRFRSASNIAFTNSLVPHLMLNQGLAMARDEGQIGLMLGYHNFRSLNMLVSLLKHKVALPEARANLKIERQPDGRFLVIVADRVTIRKILEPRFPKPSAFEV